MTATNIEIAYAKVVEVMETLVGDDVDSPFKDVFAYPNASAKLFPFAIIDIEQGVQVDESSNMKILRQNFIVRCLFRQKSTEAATIQRIRALGLVVQKFTESGVADYLDDTVIGMDLIRLDPFAISGADQPTFGFDVLIQCRMLMEVQ